MALEPHRTAHVRFEESQRGEGMARSRGRGLSECASVHEFEREGPHSQDQDRRVRLMGEVAQGKIDHRREIPARGRELAALQR
jgi:hypothetical protein